MGEKIIGGFKHEQYTEMQSLRAEYFAAIKQVRSIDIGMTPNGPAMPKEMEKLREESLTTLRTTFKKLRSEFKIPFEQLCLPLQTGVDEGTLRKYLGGSIDEKRSR